MYVSFMYYYGLIGWLISFSNKATHFVHCGRVILAQRVAGWNLTFDDFFSTQLVLGYVYVYAWLVYVVAHTIDVSNRNRKSSSKFNIEIVSNRKQK